MIDKIIKIICKIYPELKTITTSISINSYQKIFKKKVYNITMVTWKIKYISLIWRNLIYLVLTIWIKWVSIQVIWLNPYLVIITYVLLKKS